MQRCGSLSTDAVEHRVNFRKERQTLLTRRNAPHFVAIIDELALHRRLGGKAVFQRQLAHLIHAGQRVNVSVLVVPNEGLSHAGVDSPFVLIRKTARDTVAFAEGLASCLFIEEPDEVAQYASAVQRLSDQALDEQQSAKLIACLAQTNEGNELSDGQDLDPQQLQQWQRLHLR